MGKYFCIAFLFFANSSFIVAQDTMNISLEMLNYVRKNSLDKLSSGDYVQSSDWIWDAGRSAYKPKYDTIDKETYIRLYHLRDSMLKIIDNAKGKYCRFYDEENKLIEEGTWYVDAFGGEYKNYYPNGQIKEHGFYSNNPDYPLVRAKNWKYYFEDGSLYKEEKYNEKGELVKKKTFKDTEDKKGILQKQ